jgi:hypothetical protein
LGPWETGPLNTFAVLLTPLIGVFKRKIINIGSHYALDEKKASVTFVHKVFLGRRKLIEGELERHLGIFKRTKAKGKPSSAFLI